jgi:hypothetical protein
MYTTTKYTKEAMFPHTGTRDPERVCAGRRRCDLGKHCNLVDGDREPEDKRCADYRVVTKAEPLDEPNQKGVERAYGQITPPPTGSTAGHRYR